MFTKFCFLPRITRSRMQWQVGSQLIKSLLQHSLASEAGNSDNCNSEQLILTHRTSVPDSRFPFFNYFIRRYNVDKYDVAGWQFNALARRAAGKLGPFIQTENRSSWRLPCTRHAYLSSIIIFHSTFNVCEKLYFTAQCSISKSN